MAAAADRTTRSLADHHPIGISTGVFTASRGDWPTLVGAACKVSSFAVELSALSGDELPGLVRYLLRKPRLPFRYVSVHAPVKHQGLEESALVQQLAELPVWVRSIVAHPDGISAAGAFRPLGTRLVLENMDDRKNTGRTADEIEAFFKKLPDAGFCLDVAHAWSIDPTMAVAHELLDRFRSRLRHVHLSSLSDTMSPLLQTMNRCLRRYLIAAATFRGSSRRLRLRDGRRSYGRRRWCRLVRRPPATKRD